MKTLLSWSGKQSRAAADALHQWLPKILPALKPWMSSQDIDKGKRWSDELRQILKDAVECVVCITPGNLKSEWVHWETGAIAVTQNEPICPFLIGVSTSDIKDSPLNQYQCTNANRDEILQMVLSINQRLPAPEEPLLVRGRFQQHWDELENALVKVANLSLPMEVLTLIEGLRQVQDRFCKCWTTDKAAESIDPIKGLVAATAAGIEELMNAPGVNQRCKQHCTELRDKVKGIVQHYRHQTNARGDELPPAFDKAIAAIRAEHEPAST